MDPAFDAFVAAVKALTIAKRAGRVSQQQCAMAAAGAVLALEVTRDELDEERLALAERQLANTMRRLLAESDAKRVRS
jgi:hypothetical protein